MSEHILKLAPKNWQDFQHYKDRCPPWIKLHRDLLNNRDYMRLPTASKALAPLLWLLASESKEKNGAFNAETEELEFRLRMPAKDIENGLKALIHAGFFVIASKALAECVQVATPEREREESREEAYMSPAKLPTCPTKEVIELYHAALPELPAVKVETPSRRKAIAKFWAFVLTSKKTDGSPRATTSGEALDWVAAYFARVRDNTFLMGKIGRVGEHQNWQCDLDYLLTDKGMTQVIEKTREAA